MNKADVRRKEIVNILSATKKAISGGELSNQLSVSRQIIVQDISILKAKGFDIISTHSGYVLHSTPLAERVFKVKHTTEQTEQELNLIVDLGGTVVDVFVWHKVYGKLKANLNIFSRLQVKQFIEGVRTGKSTELMNITGGYHYHTVRADTEGILDRIEKALTDGNYTVHEKESI
jgi:transcriptional regulator of NAD metabolism